jgi:hypothetical protein
MLLAMISGHFVFYYPSQFATFSFWCIKTQATLYLSFVQWGLKSDERKSKKYNIMNSNKTQMKNPSNISVIPMYRDSVLNICSILCSHNDYDRVKPKIIKYILWVEISFPAERHMCLWIVVQARWHYSILALFV